jgi:hypothetical protein
VVAAVEGGGAAETVGCGGAHGGSVPRGGREWKGFVWMTAKQRTDADIGAVCWPPGGGDGRGDGRAAGAGVGRAVPAVRAPVPVGTGGTGGDPHRGGVAGEVGAGAVPAVSDGRVSAGGAAGE